MTILCMILLMMGGEFPAIIIPIAMICDVILLSIAMLTGVIHHV